MADDGSLDLAVLRLSVARDLVGLTDQALATPSAGAQAFLAGAAPGEVLGVRRRGTALGWAREWFSAPLPLATAAPEWCRRGKWGRRRLDAEITLPPRSCPEFSRKG